MEGFDVAGLLVGALQWLTVALVCAVGAVAIGRLLIWRRVAAPGALFVGVALVAFGVTQLMLEGEPFGQHYPLASEPARALFFFYFYAFNTGRGVFRSRLVLIVLRPWLLLAVVLLLQLPIPLSALSAHGAPHATLALHDLLGAFLGTGILLATFIPLFMEFRDRPYGAARWRPQMIAGWLVAAIITLGVSIWLNQVAAPNPSLPFFLLRMCWYLVVTLAPVALGLAWLRGDEYDRVSLRRRALIYGGHVVALSLVYLCVVALAPLAYPALPGAFPRVTPAQILQLHTAVDVLAIIVAIVFTGFLFRPMLAAIQSTVDYRWYHRYFDDARRVAEFGMTVQRTAQFDALTDQSTELIQEMLAPRGTTLWVRQRLLDAQFELLAPEAATDTPARKDTTWRPIIKRQPMVFAPVAQAGAPPLASGAHPTLTIAPDDPLAQALTQESRLAQANYGLLFLASFGGLRRFAPQPPHPAPLERYTAISPAAAEATARGMASALPLADGSELIGFFLLSDPVQSFDEGELAGRAALALTAPLRLGASLREQEAQRQQQERNEQEMQMARRIQQSFLPHTLPTPNGWQITPFYQPARDVGGDFYDALTLADGRIGLIIGDVAGKGTPAALIMATTRTMLRVVAQAASGPGAALAQVNDLLGPDLPPSMYVTCFYAILDPMSGRLRFANAGHDAPYRRHDNTATELHACGMPLGLLPGSQYEEGETTLAPGDALLLFTDGVTEAHNRQREMFGEARLARVISGAADNDALIADVMADLTAFTPLDWEQEDDITLLLAQRAPLCLGAEPQLLGEWSLPSAQGNERLALRRVSEIAQGLPSGALSADRLAQLETAVAEATLNAMEHGNNYQPDHPVEMQVYASASALIVRITDEGAGPLTLDAPTPNLDAKLAEEQSPRGWGLFLIKQLVDELRIIADTPGRHVVELVMALTPTQASALAAQPGVLAATDTTEAETQARDSATPDDTALENAGTIDYPAHADGERNESMQPTPPAPTGDVTISVRRLSPTVARLDVQGEITGAAEQALTQAYTEASTPQTRAIILNCTGLSYMNSLGIGLLVTLLIRLRRAKQTLLAYGLSDHYRRIFQLTRLDEAITLFASEADAVNAAARLS